MPLDVRNRCDVLATLARYCVPEPPLFRKVIKYLCGFAAAFADDKDLARHAMLLPDFGRKRPLASIPPIDGRSPKDNRG